MVNVCRVDMYPVRFNAGQIGSRLGGFFFFFLSCAEIEALFFVEGGGSRFRVAQ